MPLRTSFAGLLLAASLALPRLVVAQSVERDVERLAESMASLAERLAKRIERSANDLAQRLEREFNDDYYRERRSRSDGLLDQAMRIDTSFAFSSDGTLDLTSIYGDIVINGWDRNEATVKAWTSNGRLDYDFSRSRIMIEHVRKDRRVRDDRMRYEVSVPRGVRVKVRTTSGDIEVHRSGGEVAISTTSGDVSLADASGRVEVRAVSGDLTLRDVRGPIEASSVSGDIKLTNVEGDMRLSSTSGDLVVDAARSSDVEASTMSGDVSWDGVVSAEGRYEFRTHSGDVNLTVPASTSARFAVNTHSGDLATAFPVTLQPGRLTGNRKGREMDFAVGSGGARVVAETFSGSVDIRKR